MAPRAIAFDFGNVVGFFDHRLASNRLAAHTRMAADELHAYLFGGKLEDDYESGRISTPEFLRQVRQTCGLDCSEEELVAAYSEIFWPNPDVCAATPSEGQVPAVVGE